MRQGRGALTGVGRGGADELQGDAFFPAEDLVDAVEERGVEVADVEHLLLDQRDRAADLALVPRLLVLPRQPVPDPMPEHGHGCSLTSRSSPASQGVRRNAVAGGWRGLPACQCDVPASEARQGRCVELPLPCAAIYRRPRLFFSVGLYLLYACFTAPAGCGPASLPAMEATATCTYTKRRNHKKNAGIGIRWY